MYAPPGRDIINAYASGQYVSRMTGLIAARMWRTGQNSTEAAAALLDEARSRAIPGVGAIILPACDDRAPHASGGGLFL